MKWSVLLVVNNYCRGDAVRAEHGLSMLLKGEPETGETGGVRRIMFDTGQSWDVLSHNAGILGMDFSNIDTLVLSHGHYDHTGGLRGVLEHAAEDMILYAHPEAFLTKYSEKNGKRLISPPINKDEVKSFPIQFVEESLPLEIAPRMRMTGQIPRHHQFEEEAHKFLYVERDGQYLTDEVLDDQSIIIDGEDGGFYLICGCCHSGLLNTLEYAMKITGERRVLGIVGGLHMIGASDERLRLTVERLREYDPGFIAPLHCAGARETAVLYRELGEKVRFLGVGDTIEM